MSSYAIIQNGFVIDPEKSGIEQKEIGIIDGKLADSKDVLAQGTNIEYIDAEGAYIAPGFIDLHVHVFKDATTLGIAADLVGIKQGVTTIVDAGSSGCANYQLLKETVIEQSETEVLAFLNIAKEGLGAGLSELADSKNLMSIEEAQEIFANEPQLVGLKARMSGSVVKEQGIAPLEHARQLAGVLQKPIMVHIGNPPPYLNEVFPLLEQGDVVTHAFHGKKNGILNEEGYLIDSAAEALQRGVLFDVGHGTSSFSYQTLRKFKENYTEPFSISTDIYLNNYDNPVGSLMLTMTKLIELGFTLEEVVRAVTIRAAQAIGLTEHGTLRHGTRADLTLFTLQDKLTNLVDSEGVVLVANRVLQPKMTVRNGRVVFRQ